MTGLAEGLLVLGMHRTGTSAATRLVNLLGLALCEPDDLIKALGGNPKGHWESRSLVICNNQLLNQMDRGWWYPPRSGQAYELDFAKITVADEEARAVFDRVHPESPWVWKDPRTCVLLPYWRRALARPVAALVVFRTPLEVGDSLLRRNHIPLPAGVAMWERHYRLVLEHARGMPVHVARYHDLVTQPLKWCEAVAEFLGECGVLAGAAADPALVSDFVDTSLRHSHRDREAVPQGFASVVPVLDALEDLVGSWSSFQPPTLRPERGWVEAELVALRAERSDVAPSQVPVTVSCVLDALGLGPDEVTASLDAYMRPYEERIVVTDRPDVLVDVAPSARTRFVPVAGGSSRDAARAAGAGHANAEIVEFRRLGTLTLGRWEQDMRRAFAAGYAAVSPVAAAPDDPEQLITADGPEGEMFAVERAFLPGRQSTAGELDSEGLAGTIQSLSGSWAEARGVCEVGGRPVLSGPVGAP